MFCVQVVQSLVKTKHTALIVNSKSDNVQPVPRPQRTTLKLLQYTPLVACLLRQAFSNYNWTGIIAAIDCGTDDIDAIYNDLIKVLKCILMQLFRHGMFL